MKIVDKRRPQTVEFRTLEAGQPFYFPGEKWYGIRLANDTDTGDNAVDIETGELADIDDYAEVILLKGQFEVVG